MHRLHRTLALVAFLFILPLTLAPAGCPPTDNGDPDYTPPAASDFTVDDFLAIMETAGYGVELGHHFAMKDEDGPACLGTDIGLTNVRQVVAYAPVIDAEMQNPDGKIDLPGFQFDASECLPYLSPWPPVTPDPQLKTEIDLYFSMGMSSATTLVQLNAPTEGKECIDVQIVLSVLKAINALEPQVTEEILQDTDLVLDVPAWSVDYSTCGVDLAPEPAGDDDSA